MKLFILLAFIGLSACSTQKLADNELTAPMVNKEIEVKGGSIDRNGIRQVFINNQRELAACYTTALKTQPNLEGKLELDFDIGASGKVVRAEVGKKRTKFENTNPDELATCVLPKLKTWKFPEPPAANTTVQVMYPLRFSKN